MDKNSLIMFICIFSTTIIFILISNYEYKLTKCDYEKNKIIENNKKYSIFESTPILQRDTNLENQFEDKPYELYKDYFDQASVWIGTQWSHPSDKDISKY